MIYSFPPIVDQQSQILILGSMPSTRSLELGQYYGHKQNYFWPMLFQLFQKTYTTDYGEKKQLILEHHLAIWDVLNCCEREGSLDAKIINEKPNDLIGLLEQYPQIHTVLLNGGKAMQCYKKYFPVLYQQKNYYQMPSTSPAHTMKHEEKLAKWSVILSLIQEK